MSDPAHFQPTRWTLVIRAGGRGAEASAALSDLCAAYYAPVIQFLRREGRGEDAAREVAHSFFAQVLERGLGAPDRERGRFRNYLLGALKHFLANQRVAENREKRGGLLEHVSMPEETHPAAPESDPDLTFDREWALTLISRSLAALEAENADNAAVFTVLKPWLDGRAAESQAQAAARLGISETAVKVAIHRLRSRFREILRAEVAATVNDPAEVGAELRHLVAIASAYG